MKKAGKKTNKPESSQDIERKVKDLKSEKRRKFLFILGLTFCVIIILLTLGVFFFWISQNQP